MENENKKINHIAIAVPDTKEAALKWQQALNMKKSEIMILEEHGVKVVFLEFSNLKIELLEPLNNKSPISKFLEKNPKGGMHHICFEVEKITETINSLKNNNINIEGENQKIPNSCEKTTILNVLKISKTNSTILKDDSK